VQTIVIDSHALLAFLGGEGGAERVAVFLRSAREGKLRAVMSTVNLGEVAYVTERRLDLRSAQAALAAIDQLPIEILPVDQAVALIAAHLKAVHKLPYIDASVAALAHSEAGTVLTGDRDFTAIEHLIPVEWLPA
jgi:predicted nucleic acid-binding protein